MTQQRTEYVTVDEAAVLAGFSSNTMRRAIARGELKYRAERGRNKLLRADEVEAWAKPRHELRILDDAAASDG